MLDLVFHQQRKDLLLVVRMVVVPGVMEHGLENGLLLQTETQ